MRALFAIPDELYQAYERAFRTLRTAVHDPSASVSSVAVEVERLLENGSAEMRQAVLLALGDALGCLPLKSRAHLSRTLDAKEDAPANGY
jgi:hypothetical protein